MNHNGWCPLLSFKDEYQTKCTKDECAWYDKNQCVLFSIKSELVDISSHTSDISGCSSDAGSILQVVKEIRNECSKK